MPCRRCWRGQYLMLFYLINNMPKSSITLEQRLEELSKENELPTSLGKHLPHRGKVDYYARYKAFSDELKRHIHPEVTKAAMNMDGGYLTDHGPEHIATVIQRASDLLDLDHRVELTGYEIFLLLCAIQIHDSGHIIGGRRHHEQNGKELLTHLTADKIEKIYINEIAKVHGGVLAGDNKDTISSIEIEAPYHGVNIRLQFLAALLRFADELADDESRAARYLLISGGLPEPSQIYHAYADALKSVNVAGKEVKLSFAVDAEGITKTYGKDTGKRNRKGQPISEQVYLIDEIYDRTFKMFRECVYCMRFFPLTLQVKTISVEVKIYNYDGYKLVNEPIRYQLTESGYPMFAGNTTTLSMCQSTLITAEGKPLNGLNLKDLVEQKLTSTPSA